jgi:hypothetical protein
LRLIIVIFLSWTDSQICERTLQYGNLFHNERSPTV